MSSNKALTTGCILIVSRIDINLKLVQEIFILISKIYGLSLAFISAISAFRFSFSFRSSAYLMIE